MNVAKLHLDEIYIFLQALSNLNIATADNPSSACHCEARLARQGTPANDGWVIFCVIFIKNDWKFRRLRVYFQKGYYLK
jgi:hypothetical protein